MFCLVSDDFNNTAEILILLFDGTVKRIQYLIYDAGCAPETNIRHYGFFRGRFSFFFICWYL